MKANGRSSKVNGLILGLTMIGLAASVQATSAAVATDIRAGVYTDVDAVGVGAGLLAPIGRASDRWYFNPNAELALGDRDVITLNGDVHYDLSYQQPTAVWLGAGPAVIMRDDLNNDRQTELGMNVLAGIGATRGNMRPYGQVKGIVADSNGGVALMGGVRF